MRILHLIDSLSVGGAQQLLFLTLAATRDRVQHQMVALHAEGDRYAAELRRLGIPVEFASAGRRLGSTVRAVRSALTRTDVDVVHAHLPVSTMLACLLRPCSAPAALVVSMYAMREQLPSWLYPVYGALLRRTDRVITGGPEVAAQLGEVGIRAPRVVEVQMHVATPMENYTADAATPSRNDVRRLLGVDADDLVLLRVARLHPDKGVDDLVRVVAELRGRGVSATALVVGDGTERAALEHLAATLRVSEHVRFLGFRTDLAALHAAVDVVVVSARKEALGHATIEAMCYGVPVVAYSMGAFPRFIEDGVTGALVGAGDLGALVKRIHELYREPGRLASIGAAGRRSVQEQLGPEGLVRSLLPVWAAAAAAHRGEPSPPAEYPASK